MNDKKKETIIIFSIIVGLFVLFFTVGFVFKAKGDAISNNELYGKYEGMKDQFVLTDGFDYPVGWPDAQDYYSAQNFGENNHLAEDWNGLGGCDSDFGDPIYAVANGKVVYAQNAGPGWGNTVKIVHKNSEKPVFVESLYAS